MLKFFEVTSYADGWRYGIFETDNERGAIDHYISRLGWTSEVLEANKYKLYRATPVHVYFR